jgi:hypothetical protein
MRSRGPLVVAVGLEPLARRARRAVARLSEELCQRPHTSMLYAAPRITLAPYGRVHTTSETGATGVPAGLRALGFLTPGA